MRSFDCACGARLFFENTRCLSCARELGFSPESGAIVALEPRAGDGDLRSANYGRHRKCANYSEYGVCNWLVPSESPETLCQACRLNHVIPNLSDPRARALWADVEQGKRRLVYTLNSLGLPLASKAEDPERGLAFDIKADTGSTRVLTGHEDGLITLNVAEADPAEREKMRVAMKERYRTMLGHFRHEIGHYYWDRLVADTACILRFRELFGDERADYAAAIERHYRTGASSKYAATFVSSYAAAHPWEDFAETFAHYLHMVDTLETAQDFGLAGGLERRTSVTNVHDFELLMQKWTELALALNALNRSMGLPDAYPFVISPAVKSKIAFVHGLVLGPARKDPG